MGLAIIFAFGLGSIAGVSVGVGVVVGVGVGVGEAEGKVEVAVVVSGVVELRKLAGVVVDSPSTDPLIPALPLPPLEEGEGLLKNCRREFQLFPEAAVNA